MSKRVKDPLIYMARLCKSRASKGGDDHYHIFINSVEGIAKIIRLAGLNPSQCRIVCSQSENTKDGNQKKLGEFEIKSTSDPVRLFNFYTSTCFEGQDIFDPIGRTFIVSEAYKDHTKMDVTTSLLQICGRVRDSKFRTEINQIYATSKYKDVTPEEFEATIRKKVEDAKHDAELFNEMAQDRKERLISRYIFTEPFMGVENGVIVVDQNLANYEIVNYRVVNGQYASKCKMMDAIGSTGIQVKDNDQTMIEDDETEPEKGLSIERTPFKTIFEEYATIRESKGYNLGIFRASRIEIEKPLVKEAYDVLGPARVREMRYHQSNIKKEIIKKMHASQDTKVFLLLDKRISKQVAIPRQKVVKLLEDVYDELGIVKKAKASDLKNWYEIKETTKRGDDGRPQSCICIITSLIKHHK